MRLPIETRNPVRRALTSLLLLTVMSAIAPLSRAADDIVIIVNKDNPNQIDRAFVVQVYTGAVKGWPDGSPVFALDQAEDAPARHLFCTTILGRSMANVRAIWSQNIFTGKGLPPRVAGVDAEMKQIVAANRHAIGYIRASAVDSSVRVVGR